MAASVSVILDTTPPTAPELELALGAADTTILEIPGEAITGDPDTSGYQVKVWGDVDPSGNPAIQTTEGASSWMGLSGLITILLSAGVGLKTVNARIRDTVWNQTAPVSDTITVVAAGTQGTQYVRISGTWGLAPKYVRIDGEWVEVEAGAL